MKIVYINADYTEKGGTEKILSQKTNYWVENKHEVFIVSILKSNHEPFFEFDPRIQILKMNMKNEETNKENVKYFICELDKILHAIKPDISIAMDMRLAKYLYKATDSSKKILESHFSKFKRKNQLSKLNSFWPGNLIANLFVRNQTKHIKKFNQFVVLTEEDRKQWSNLKENVCVIHNVLEYNTLIEVDYSKKRIIGVGRLSGQKGWEYLIKIWAKLAPSYPEWEVAIFGDGHKQNMLNKLIIQNRIEDSFKIHIPTPLIKQEYAKSSIFVMTSRYEGLPMVLIEAMGLGLPPVTFTFKCGPRDMIIDNKTGLLVDLFSVDDFVDKIKRLMDNENLRREMGLAAQKETLKRFAKQKIMDQWEALFTKLINS